MSSILGVVCYVKIDIMNYMQKVFSLILAVSIVWAGGVSTLHASVSYDIDTSTNWNIRIDGAVAGNWAGYGQPILADVDGNGKEDILIKSWFASNNGRATSGSLWIIYDSILDDYTGTGNTIDLADSSKWNIRIDGAVAGDFLSIAGVQVADINNDGSQDVLVSAYAADNREANTGSLYVLYGTLLDDYTGTGNTIDMADSSNWNVRYDGSEASEQLTLLDALEVGDVNNNNAPDLLVGSRTALKNSRADSGSVYVIYDDILDDYTGTGNIINLATTTNWNIRYDGAVTDDFLSNDILAPTDFDGNGLADLMIGAYAKNTTEADAGSVYYIPDSLIDDYTGTGNIVDMASSTNWRVRYDGDSYHGVFGAGLDTGDLDGDGKADLLIAANDSNNDGMLGVSGRGWAFAVLGSSIDDYTGTGNVVGMGTSTNYFLRIAGETLKQNMGQNPSFVDVDGDGLTDILTRAQFPEESTADNTVGVVHIFEGGGVLSGITGTGTEIVVDGSDKYDRRYVGTSGYYLGQDGLKAGDLNDDGRMDLVISARGASFNSRASSGSTWIIYNFPHSLTATGDASLGNGSEYTVSGSVSASDSATTVTSVEYRVDDTTPTAEWTACTADDASFDETTEDYTCTIPSLSLGSHTVYVRAEDSNGAYTLQDNYASQVVAIESSGLSQRTPQQGQGGSSSSGLVSKKTSDDEHEEDDSQERESNTTTQLRDELLEQLADLEEQLALLTGSGQSTDNVCFAHTLETTFGRDLRSGMQGEDVLNLQKVLNSDLRTRLSEIDEPGALGQETDYFGLLTFEAVKKLQELCRDEILTPLDLGEPTGFVGPSTRAVLNK